MRVKKVFCLLLMVACLMVQAVPVFAAGDVDISSLPTPQDGTVLISKNDYVVQNGENMLVGKLGDEKYLTYMYSSPCKVITYQPSSGLYWSGQTVLETRTDEGGVTEEIESFKFKGYSSFSEASSNAQVCTVGDTLPTILDLDAVVVFVQNDVPSFKCSLPNLPNYGEVENKLPDNLTPIVNVDLVERLEAGGNVYGAKFRVTYKLPGYAVGSRLETEFASCVYVSGMSDVYTCDENSASGSIEFDLTTLQNKDYEFCLKTTAGHVYTVKYAVDFINGAMDVPYSGSFDAPKITVAGIPNADETVVAPVVLTLKSDIPCTVLWNGVQLQDGYATEFTVTVPENGNYRYVATSEIGRSTDGVLTFTNISGAAQMSGLDLLSTTGNLVQTGIETDSSTSIVLPIVVIIGVVILSVGFVVFYRKRGEKA